MTTPSETRAGKLLPVMIGEMRNFADVADRCEVTNAPPAIRTWADQLETLAASEPEEVACHRWLRDGEPVGPWTDGVPSGRQFESAIQCAEIASWTVEYAYTHPAPEQPGKGEAAVDFVCTGYLAALSDAYHTLKGTDRQFQADKLSELHTLLARTPLYATPQQSDPAEGDAIDGLDFEPDEQHTVADMANVGRSLMREIANNMPHYCWNESPAEIVCDLINERDEALSTPPTAAVRVDTNDILFVGFDKNMEKRLFHLRDTAERHCIGEIKTYAALDPQVKR